MASLARFQKIASTLDPGARRIRALIRDVARHLEPMTRVLDLGSGDAPYRAYFPCGQYVTADPFGKAAVRSVAGAVPFEAGAFDLVLCTEVLEHVPDPDAALREIHRVLGARGVLVLSTPLTWGVHAPWDYHRWTEMGLRALLSARGFRVREIKPRGGLFLTLSALLLVIPWQVLGEARERTWWQTALFAVTYPLLVIPATAVAALDPLDRRQHFTLGYVVLCDREASSGSIKAASR
jgi:SAM-dependent methyltransferase